MLGLGLPPSGNPACPIIRTIGGLHPFVVDDRAYAWRPDQVLELICGNRRPDRVDQPQVATDPSTQALDDLSRRFRRVGGDNGR